MIWPAAFMFILLFASLMHTQKLFAVTAQYFSAPSIEVSRHFSYSPAQAQKKTLQSHLEFFFIYSLLKSLPNTIKHSDI